MVTVKPKIEHKSRIHANYTKCLEEVARGGRVPHLKSKYQSSFGNKKLRIFVPPGLF